MWFHARRKTGGEEPKCNGTFIHTVTGTPSLTVNSVLVVKIGGLSDPTWCSTSAALSNGIELFFDSWVCEQVFN